MKTALPLLAAALAGCATPGVEEGPQARFFATLQSQCGKAFEGRIASPPVEADAAFAGKRLLMHVRGCSRDEIRIPFHVGEDRSRTWVVTRTRAGLRLKHDHRHSDGSEDKLTQYGGDTAGEGMAQRQEFPADDFSKALFVRENIPASTANVWAMEAGGRAFAYELRRPGRFFRVEFDLSRPVAEPPAPWGSE
jgi:sarcosine oxidase delta subunit